MNAKVAGANVYLDIARPAQTVSLHDATQQDDSTTTITYAHRALATLANKQNYNAVRLWIGGESPAFANIALISAQGWSPASDSTLPSTIDDITSIHGYRDRIRSILKTCESLNMGVILVCGNPVGVDLVTYGKDQNATNDANRDAIVGFWKQCVKEFGTEKALIGIDLINEPPDKPASGNQFPKIDDNRTARYGWPQIAQEIIKGVRAQEQSMPQLTSPTPIVVCCSGGQPLYMKMFNAPSPLGSSPTYLYDPALADSRWSSQLDSAGASGWIVYEFHAYESISITSQGREGLWPALGWTYPSGSLRRIKRYWDAQGNWIEDAINAVAEDWGTKIEPMNNMDDVATQWQEPLALQTAAQSGGKTQPIFVGEFSFLQPVLEEVYPPNPDRTKLTWTDDHHSLAASVTTGSEQKKYLPQWSDVASHPVSRWITEFDIFPGPDGLYVRAYFDNINRLSYGRLFDASTGIPSPPEPPLDGKTPTKRKTADCHPIKSDFAMGFNVPATRTPPSDPDPRKWAASNFQNQVLMTVTAGAPGTDRFAVTKATVTIQADRYWVEYKAPDPSVTQGIYRTGAGAAGTYYPPIAIASFFSATSGATMEASRARYIQDVLCAAQKYQFSWSYHAYSWPLGFIGWTPGPQMSDILREAALGRQLPRRAGS
jgi:hypothetical protein